MVGALIGYFMSSSMAGVIPFILPFAAGGFIYIAASDLIPELHKEPVLKKAMVSFAFFVIGIVFMLLIKLQFA
jgi:zinc and cadmium transporter